MDNKSNVGKHLVVVGASRGLGATVVRHFARLGWLVSFGARNTTKLVEIENELRREGREVSYFPLDVSKETSVHEFFNSAETTYGPIHAVIHLAAVYKPFGAVRNLDSSSWAEAIQTNVNGTFYVVRHALLKMPKSTGGDIVVLSGGGATSPMPTISAYAASKCAVVRFVESVALEESDGLIRINALAPGLMATDMLQELIDAGPDIVNPNFYERMLNAKLSGDDTTDLAVECIDFLLNNKYTDLTGLLISAKWDDWKSWRDRGSGNFKDPIYRLRRITPESKL